MKLEKIYKMIIKQFEKSKYSSMSPGEHFLYDRCETEDFNPAYFVSDAYRAFIIPENDFPFDFEKVSKDFICKSNRILRDLNDGYKESIATNEMQEVVPAGKKSKSYFVKKYVTEDGTFAWFNTKLLDCYEEDSKLFIRDEISPAKVYCRGVLEGIVLPVRMNKEEMNG